MMFDWRRNTVARLKMVNALTLLLRLRLITLEAQQVAYNSVYKFR